MVTLVGPITRVLKNTKGRQKREGESRMEAGSESLDGAGFEGGGRVGGEWQASS